MQELVTKELTQKYGELSKKTKQYENEITQLLGAPPGVSGLRAGCFVIIQNKVTLAMELLSYYDLEWSRQPRPHPYDDSMWSLLWEVTPERLQERLERLMAVAKWLFVDSLSSIEYSAKASLASYPQNSPARNLASVKGPHVYLNSIMRNSKTLGLISKAEYEDWQNIIWLRNCTVHNNGIPDIDKDFVIGGLRVVQNAGKMPHTRLDFYVVLTEAAIDRYFTWVKAIIQKYGN